MKRFALLTVAREELLQLKEFVIIRQCQAGAAAADGADAEIEAAQSKFPVAPSICPVATTETTTGM